MALFDLGMYSAATKDLLSEPRELALGPGTPNQAAKPLLKKTNPAEIAPRAVSPELAAACLSGLWLWHDFLDESHEISQDLPSAEGSYWHGIMHRREPDYSNAKYWYRRVGEHPIFPDLLQRAQDVAAESDPSPAAARLAESSQWDPYAFVDLCSTAARGGEDMKFCRAVATWEWWLLFNHCYGV